jgi:hypothetical protein
MALVPTIRSLVIVVLIGLIFHALASQTAARSRDWLHRKPLEGRRHLPGMRTQSHV